MARELQAANEAVGEHANVQRFVTDILRACGGIVTVHEDGRFNADITECPAGLQDAMGLATFDAHFEIVREGGGLLLTRTHPVVEALAAYTLDQALDPIAKSPASRCGVIRTRTVNRRTTLLLVRLRLHVTIGRNRNVNALLVEDALVLAFTGSPNSPEWLDRAGAEALLEATPDANVPPELAIGQVKAAIDRLSELSPSLETTARERADVLLEAHRRVRDAARVKGATAVTPQLPLDVLGIYVLLPIATT